MVRPPCNRNKSGYMMNKILESPDHTKCKLMIHSAVKNIKILIAKISLILKSGVRYKKICCCRIVTEMICNRWPALSVRHVYPVTLTAAYGNALIADCDDTVSISALDHWIITACDQNIQWAGRY
jgi:hypothetical protein